MKCLVTGAGGFIGQSLCHTLRESGHEVVPLSRREHTLQDGTTANALDLVQEPIPTALFEGVQAVIHVAGVAHTRATATEYQALNVDATLALAKAAAEARVSRFVYVSSVKAMGDSPFAAPRSEEDFVTPTDHYGRSKWQAERGLHRLWAEIEMSIAIVRPALVYGPDVRGNLHLLARWAQLGLPRPPRGGKRSMIAVDDLTALLVSVAAQTTPEVQTLIAAANQYSAQDVYDQVRRSLGRSLGKSWLPRSAWRAATTLHDLMGGGEKSFDKLFKAELYDNAKALAETDWQPRWDLGDVAGQLLMRRA